MKVTIDVYPIQGFWRNRYSFRDLVSVEYLYSTITVQINIKRNQLLFNVSILLAQRLL